MKTVLRYFMVLAVCLIPFTFVKVGTLNERFPIMIGITIGVTIAFWVGNAIIQKKRKQQEKNSNEKE